MATVPIDETFVTVREYLRTSYSPDCEYVDGRIVERLWGEMDHSILQGYFIYLFHSHRLDWGVDVFPSLRTKVSATRFCVPDVLVVRDDLHVESILDQPPLIVIEILSPEDQWSRMQEKADDFLAFGTEHIWVFDPIRRLAWTADRSGLHLVNADALNVPGTPIRVEIGDVFAALNRA